MEIMPNRHPHEVLHYKQPRRHVVCLDVWETIFDMVQGSTDSDVPPILAACAGVCQELRCIAEGRLYKHLILGDRPGINTYLFRQVRPIHTEEISYLLRKRHLKSAINESPAQSRGKGRSARRQQRVAVAHEAWYSLHPTALYRILNQSPHLTRYIRTVKAWPSEHDKHYTENPSMVYSYLLSRITGTWSFHEFESGLPSYIMYHLNDHISTTNLDFAGVKNFQVNSLLRQAPLHRLGLGEINTEIVHPICDLEFQDKFELEILAIDFAAGRSAEEFYYWFQSLPCPIHAGSVVSLDLSWVDITSIVLDKQSSGPFRPIYWLFMACPNIKDLSIHVSDTIKSNDEKRYRPYPQPFSRIAQEGRYLFGDTDDWDAGGVSNHAELMTTSSLSSLNSLRTLTFSGIYYYDLSYMALGDALYPGHSCLPAFRYLLQSLMERRSPSAVNTVTFIMDFDYPRLFDNFPDPLNLPVVSEWRGIVDMLLSARYMPNLENVIFAIKPSPRNAKSGEATRIKKAFSALDEIQRLSESKLVVWKD